MFASMRLVALPQSGKGPEANVSTSNQKYLTPEIADFAAAQLHYATDSFAERTKLYDQGLATLINEVTRRN